MADRLVSWWRTEFGEPAIDAISRAIRNERIGQGSLSEAFETAFASRLGVKHAVVVTSGSVALYLALLAKGIKAGDEVLVPDRTWVASAHAPYMLGAKPILLDVLPEIPAVDTGAIESKITPKTKAIIPVHLNGRGCDMDVILDVAKRYDLLVVEDACQALFSEHSDGSYMGTSGDAGCFSLGTTKLISSGQGGVIVTNDDDYFEKLKLVRNHGVVDQFTDRWSQFGFNFKFTDFQAAMVHQQLESVDDRLLRLRSLYGLYADELRHSRSVHLIPFQSSSELPLYVEAITPDRDRLISYMASRGIQCRPYPPSLHTSEYLHSGGNFPNSSRFNEQGLYLPSGPHQPEQSIQRVLEALRGYR